ncbi:NAD(P)/FAD-dependent oxidoreductase [Allostreptomyces psammosilenae]|uniref:2-polyprenyl-6-methoxyphenol hydroxylase-like FAD-dependent oxidoreductase n=1 Tax=Allostreptomyces psammosilenae TaxID=1892865 RepID=A0A852ZVG3_9ACTN|nr:FAD-dependent monooxygenase [Allostreptomyces psammosilenae]NYI05627.1 2-polyprenyl-6-methoxyphenol hydroxylase-like FAD-dependent oxidoreductase [Allostreptomyces psammosilenae]
MADDQVVYPGGSASRAVVIGGGLAGLLAARVLADHAGSVTVVERDRYPDGPAYRKGVPQSRHTHIFLTGGQEALESLLPGALGELAAAGAKRLALPRDLLVHTQVGWQRRYHHERHSMLCCTRPLLDHVVRARILADPRIEVLQATDAVSLVGDARRVTGVRVRSRDGERGERELPAELVVDATGRGSRAPEWLRALGITSAPEEESDSGIAYATRAFRMPKPPLEDPNVGLYIQPQPDCPRGGGIIPVEDDQWLLTVYGTHGHHPDTAEESFLEFTTRLPDSFLHEVMRDAEPLSPIHGFQNTANRRRRYDRMEPSWAEGFVAIGDAACTFNPVYGQGMSVACLGAVALRRVLAEAGGLAPGVAAAARGAIAQAAESAWITATGADQPYIAMAGSGGGRPATRRGLAERFQGWYLTRLVAHAAVDRVVGAAFRDVAYLTAPPTRLFSPAVALRTVFLPYRPASSTPPLVVEPAG